MTTQIKKRLFLVSIFLVVVASSIIRFIKLDKVPASLYYDEIDLGYQVRSLLTTGKDYRGGISPFYFRSFNTDKTPFPIFFSALPSLLFSKPEYQVRAGAVLAGTLVVILSMIIASQFSNKKSVWLATGLVFGFSPWMVHFSRIAFEAIFMMMLFMSTLLVFLSWVNTKKDFTFYLSALLLGLNVYTYRTMSLFVPLMSLLIAVVYWKDFWKMGLLKCLVWLLILLGLVAPFLYFTTVRANDQTRISQISIFSDPLVPIKVVRSREIDSNDFGNPEVGKKPVWWSKIFHNKAISYLTYFSQNYYKNFSSEFLFISGDPNNRHNPNGTGELLYIDVVGLGVGFWVLVKNIKNKRYQLLLGVLMLSPVAADITMDGGNHASRLMILACPLLLIIGMGYSEIVEKLSKKSRHQPLILVIALLWLVNVAFFVQNYFVHYPVESAKEFGYGYKESTLKIGDSLNQFKNIRLSNFNDSPLLYYLFWSGTPPLTLQKYGTEFGDEIHKDLELDKVKLYARKDRLCVAEEIKNLSMDTIYMVTYMNLPIDFRGDGAKKIPLGIKLLDIVKYPNNEIAFYLITRDSKNGLPVMPKLETYCL